MVKSYRGPLDQCWTSLFGGISLDLILTQIGNQVPVPIFYLLRSSDPDLDQNQFHPATDHDYLVQCNPQDVHVAEVLGRKQNTYDVLRIC